MGTKTTRTARSNSNSDLLALLLGDARKGTFTGLITRKRGVDRGRGAARQTFGDDEVHVTILTGFRYENLVRRSLEQLRGLDLDAVLAEATAKGRVDGKGNLLTKADFENAKAELIASFERSLDDTQESTSTTKDVFETLTLDGETVRGARVYKCSGKANCQCRNCTGDAKAPLPGTIYLQGLRIHETVITPAPNGPAPKPKSAAKTVAKNLLRSKLPVRRYVSYRLEPGTDFILRAGGTAEAEAVKHGFVATDDLLDTIARCA